MSGISVFCNCLCLFSCIALPNERNFEQLNRSSSLILSVCDFWKECTAYAGRSKLSMELPPKLQECTNDIMAYVHTSVFTEEVTTCKVRA